MLSIRLQFFNVIPLTIGSAIMSPPAAKISKRTDIVADLATARAKVASDVTAHTFSRQELDRFKLVRGDEAEVEESCKSGVLYWMRRDRRVQGGRQFNRILLNCPKNCQAFPRKLVHWGTHQWQLVCF